LDTSIHGFLKVENITVNRSGRNVLDGISFSLDKNESLAIVGPSGSGKTMLGLALAKKIFYRGNITYANDNKIVWVEQQHHFKNLQHTNDLYYQQRFNSYDTEETETVIESLGEDAKKAEELLKEMEIQYLKDERLIQLSNGENKKLQLLKARLEEPSVIIFDQPFIGIDKETRAWLRKQIDFLRREGVLTILITAPDEIPESISKVLSLEDGKIKSLEKLESFKKRVASGQEIHKKTFDRNVLSRLLKYHDETSVPEPVIKMSNVTVQYDEKIILNDINWEVKKGERWLLSGPNGAGKSTLLSLITADNPKAYANSIYLFGRKRGSGESIWDIKRKIGFISPELHLYFNQSSTCFETIASGLFDTIGLFRQISDDDADLVKKWMKFCRIESSKLKRLYELSVGEQRIVLLTRALIKNPPLLILDEPCQGLDNGRKEEFLELVNETCLISNKTMIFVSHYENEIPACITNSIQLDHGKISEIK
jgi:molybdate transport system ATP-binding protein